MQYRSLLTPPPDHREGERGPAGRMLSKEAINALPLGGFAGRIDVVESAAAAEACAALQAGAGLDGRRVLGFDTESRPAFRRGEQHPIALVQLATSELACLFRVDPQSGPAAALREILEDGAVVKVAQGPAAELRELLERWGISAQAVVDLIPAARAAGCAPLSLRGLAAAYLGIRISKGAQTSNWAAPQLNPRQQRYAATDAWACREIYRVMGCPPLEPVAAVLAGATGAAQPPRREGPSGEAL